MRRSRLLIRNGYFIMWKSGKKHYLHRWIMENHLKRKLKMFELVHHKNGNRSDNRIENLQLTSGKKEHAKLHKELNKQIK